MTTLTMKDEKRIEAIQRVFRGELTVGEAARALVGSPISSGLAMPRNLAGANPAQVTASHGPGIQPCSQSGNRLIDA